MWWFQSAHPIQDAMATHSWIHQIRALTPSRNQQNQRVLGNLSPLAHPRVRLLREETSRFYDHLGGRTQIFLWLIELFVLRSLVVKVSPHLSTNFIWSIRHPTTRQTNLTPQSTASPNLSFSLSIKHYLQIV